MCLPQQLCLARFSRVPSSSQLKLRKGPKTGSEPGLGSWEVRGKPVGCRFIQGAARSGIWGAPSHAQRLGAAPGLDQQWGVTLGRWAALGRKAGRPSAPAHVHGSAGVWSQPKALSGLQWALLSLLGLLSPSPSPHWTPHGSPTSVAVISASALPLPAACLLPPNPHHSAMMSFTIFPLASFSPPTSSPLPALPET